MRIALAVLFFAGSAAAGKESCWKNDGGRWQYAARWPFGEVLSLFRTPGLIYGPGKLPKEGCGDPDANGLEQWEVIDKKTGDGRWSDAARMCYGPQDCVGGCEKQEASGIIGMEFLCHGCAPGQDMIVGGRNSDGTCHGACFSELRFSTSLGVTNDGKGHTMSSFMMWQAWRGLDGKAVEQYGNPLKCYPYMTNPATPGVTTCFYANPTYYECDGRDCCLKPEFKTLMATVCSNPGCPNPSCDGTKIKVQICGGPSPTPPGPTPPGCTDSSIEEWSYKNKKDEVRGCDKIANNPEKRCPKFSSEAGVPATKGCPFTCGTCTTDLSVTMADEDAVSVKVPTIVAISVMAGVGLGGLVALFAPRGKGDAPAEAQPLVAKA